MLEGVEVLCHSSIRIDRGKVIYVDPFHIDKDRNDADLCFITHPHYDHFSLEDIKKVVKDDTIIVLPDAMYEEKLPYEHVIYITPNTIMEIGDIEVDTIPAYNLNKPFHKREERWLGYLLTIDGVSYYIAGDTDATPESMNVNCDVAFLPVGGTYTMNAKEAAKLVRTIRPKIVIPIHYGSIVGSIEDAESLKSAISDISDCRILLK